MRCSSACSWASGTPARASIATTAMGLVEIMVSRFGRPRIAGAVVSG